MVTQLINMKFQTCKTMLVTYSVKRHSPMLELFYLITIQTKIFINYLFDKSDILLCTLYNIIYMKCNVFVLFAKGRHKNNIIQNINNCRRLSILKQAYIQIQCVIICLDMEFKFYQEKHFHHDFLDLCQFQISINCQIKQLLQIITFEHLRPF